MRLFAQSAKSPPRSSAFCWQPARARPHEGTSDRRHRIEDNEARNLAETQFAIEPLALPCRLQDHAPQTRFVHSLADRAPRDGFAEALFLLTGDRADVVKANDIVRDHRRRGSHRTPLLISDPTAEFPRGYGVVEYFPKPCSGNVKA